MLCEKHFDPGKVLVICKDKCAHVPIDIYKKIRMKLATKISKYDRARLPNVTSSRTVIFEDRDDLRLFSREYENFLDDEDEICGLQSDAGDIERKIESYPLTGIVHKRKNLAKIFGRE